ncbi:uncharacterized protein AMSG_04282 [Thecamonas trahens ATCC 50062]|uniref:Vesicle tethering protein Uso1/P115-like head domain-containing protein n=1 Tax=Thecamonas trahens ATCC 50062 TaxID=461836 RepID=A0A0L0D6S3_THETB|nr:hypothetical protein AMSG_04282 [Thecamonas trahens ATCC 50062]KNC48049.1 hypothetical protein AMSG_04282 [Thecamonas trahens ATCC 50062]|eukprot:XP_013759064.1 hypothetical protein AMSG_04282 [Thecamonas trahens ATCC 50062]
MSFLPGFMKDAMMGKGGQAGSGRGRGLGGAGGGLRELEVLLAMLAEDGGGGGGGGDGHVGTGDGENGSSGGLVGEELAKVYSEVQKHVSMAPASKAEIGMRVIDHAMHTLASAPLHAEAARAALGLLAVMVSPSDGESNHAFNHSPAGFNASLVVDEDGNVETLLGLVGADDFYVRFYALRLLTALLKVKTGVVQGKVLMAPHGIAKIMDTLDESREMLRNEGLLLLLELTHGNQEVQKVIAFESAFQRLFTIIGNEGYADGNIVVADALAVLRNLLDGNASNQLFFRETSCFEYLVPLLQVDPDELRGLSDGACTNYVLGLDLLSILVSGSSPAARANQAAAGQLGFLKLAWNLSAERVRAPSLRARALRTVGDMLAGSDEHQRAFMTLGVPAGNFSRHADPAVWKTSSLAHLITVVLNAAAYEERASAACAVISFLEGNAEGQMALASTLAPSPEELEGGANSPVGVGSVGRLLVASLLAGDAAGGGSGSGAGADAGLTHGGNLLEEVSLALGGQMPVMPGSHSGGPSFAPWFAAVVLSHMFYNNAECKQLVLHLPLEMPAAAAEPVHLLDLVVDAVLSSIHDPSEEPDVVRPQAALLSLLNVWSSSSPATLEALVQHATLVPALVETVILTSGPLLRRALCALLLGQFVLHGPASSAGEDSHALDAGAIVVLLRNRIGVEAYFGVLDELLNSVQLKATEQARVPVMHSADADDVHKLVFFDYAFARFCKSTVTALDAALVSGRPSAAAAGPHPDTRALAQAKHQLASLRSANASLKNDNAKLEARVAELEATAAAAPPPVAPPAVPPAMLESLERENLELREQVHELKSQAMAAKTGIPQVDPRELERLRAENASLRREIQDVSSASAASTPTGDASRLAAELQEAQSQAAQLADEHADLNTQHEELLVFLGEMEMQITAFKALLDDNGIDYAHLLPADDDEYEYDDEEDDDEEGSLQ